MTIHVLLFSSEACHGKMMLECLADIAEGSDVDGSGSVAVSIPSSTNTGLVFSENCTTKPTTVIAKK